MIALAAKSQAPRRGAARRGGEPAELSATHVAAGSLASSRAIAA
jgi:hypothetical protein